MYYAKYCFLEKYLDTISLPKETTKKETLKLMI